MNDSPTSGPQGRGPDAANSAAAAAVPARGRGILGFIYPCMLVLAAFLLFFGNLLIWVNSSVLDSEHFSAKVHDVLREPEVQDRLATVLAQQAVDTGVIQEQVDTRVPQQVSFLAPVLNSQLETLLAEAAKRLLATDLAGNLEREITLRLHAQLLAILSDDETAIEVQGDSLVLDLRELLDRLFDAAGVNPPERLQQMAGGFGTFVILEDTTGLRQASWFIENREEIIFGLMAGALIAFGLALLLAPEKRNGVGAIGYAVLAVGIFTLLAVLVSNIVLGQVAPENIAGRELLRALEDNLRWQSLGLAVVGACLVVASDTRTLAAIDGLEGRMRSRFDRLDPGTRRYVLPVAGGGLVLLLLLAA